MASFIATPPPMLWPTTWYDWRPSASTMASTSSTMSSRPRVASTGSGSVSP